MQLEFHNLGPIEYGNIDLSKRITAFVGYNSSGKTYASQLVWGVYDLLGRYMLVWGYDYFSKEVAKISLDTIHELIISKDVIQGFKKFINDKLNAIILEEIFASDAEIVGKDFSMTIDYDLNYKEKSVRHENIYRVLVSNKNKRRPDDEVTMPDTIKVSVLKSKGSEKVSINLEYLLDMPFKKNPRPYPLIVSRISEKEPITRLRNIVANRIVRSISPDILEPFFLPSNRTFFPSYYRFIYQDATERLGRVSEIASTSRPQQDDDSISQIKQLSKRRYTKPVSQLIDFLYNIDSSNDDDYNEKLLSQLEGIMGGKIEYDRPEGVGPAEFKLDMGENNKLDLHLASSSTNQLASLYLYLKQDTAFTEPNILIMDEPEENLHPSNQIKLLDLLVQFADKGNYVLFTTHSPLVANALNNYSMMRYRAEHKIDAIPKIDNTLNLYNPKNLTSDDFGVYFIGDRTIVEYRSTKFGAYFKDFSEVENQLKQMADALRGDIFNM